MQSFIYDLIAEEGEQFESSSIETLAYNREDNELYVEFRSGGEYAYSDVEESTYNAIWTSGSVGSIIANNVVNKFTRTPIDYAGLTHRQNAEGDVVTEPASGWELTDKERAEWSRITTTNTTNAKAPSLSSRYSVRWAADGFASGITFEPEFVAADENHAIMQFKTQVLTILGGAVEPRILSVTRYLD